MKGYRKESLGGAFAVRFVLGETALSTSRSLECDGDSAVRLTMAKK